MGASATTGGGVTTTIAPNLIVADGVKAIEFYTAAFGAVVLHQVGGDAGVAELSVDGATFWLAAGESQELRRFTPASLSGRSVSMILTVEDPDAVWNQAVAAGAAPGAAVAEDYGWRVGSVMDPFGHYWEIGRPLGQWPPA
jgi:PhnB protein